ncbi:unnamed protein product [Ambrosiozyma monospora]|uniref:Unnamed protein product n=1 Tax=Ambrosiozyma monospora TaxID=43982 RepID=A0A9W6Z8Q0_AMBMO|nr:unnamed protein product [Ambrosiozyma monospora]
MAGKGNINYPPYAINNNQPSHDIAEHGLSPNATHLDGTLEYDIHNLYGYTESKVTYDSLLEIISHSSPNSITSSTSSTSSKSKNQKRPFIISRSTHTGSGKYTGNWGGDNESTWKYMVFSISQALQFGQFGIPFFGVDACGFGGNSNEELCNRWMQLASFFPFYRNHNALDAEPQEPYRWFSVARATKRAMDVRYSLLPYYYTLLNEAHETGVPLLRATNWVFSNDDDFIGLDEQFFVGDGLIVVPGLQAGIDKVGGVFPGISNTDNEHREVYYDWYSHELLTVPNEDNNGSKSDHITIDAPIGHIPLFVRGGHIIPCQKPRMTVAESRQTDFDLLIALNVNGAAKGELYLDDGETLDPEETLTVEFIIDTNGNTKTFISKSKGKFYVGERLSKVTILGVDQFGGGEPTRVIFKERGSDSENLCLFEYVNGNLVISNLQGFTDGGAFTEDFEISWS